jgi:hypothetical protein
MTTAPIARLIRAKKPQRRPPPSEHDLQVAVINWAKLHEKRYPALELLHATPNGGHRYISVALKLKAEGVKPGIPDLCLPAARKGFNGLYIELKTNTGRLSHEQAGWLDRLNEAGYMAVLCRGDKAAIETIKSYLGIE